MHQNIEMNENPVQSIQNLRRAESLPSNRTMDLNTQQEWLIDNNWDWTQANISEGTYGVWSLPPSNQTELETWRGEVKNSSYLPNTDEQSLSYHTQKYLRL